jgi:hypothetical protein
MHVGDVIRARFEVTSEGTAEGMEWRASFLALPEHASILATPDDDVVDVGEGVDERAPRR